MNKALRIWADENEYNSGRSSKGLGRITGLAKHLGVSQPAVSKMIDGSNQIKFKYIAEIIEFTGIKAKDLLPEYYELFEDDFHNQELATMIEIDKQKQNAIQLLNQAISNIENQ